MSFSFLPADIVSQILNFGAPAPIDLQIRGANHEGELRLRQQAAEPDPPHSRHRRRAHPAIAERADLQHRCRPHPRAICRPDRARRHQQPRGQSRRQFAGRADLLPQPRQRRVLFDRDADAAIQDGLAERAAGAADHRDRQSAGADPRRHRRHQALDLQRRGVAIRHPVDGADLRHDAGPRSRRGRRRRPDRDGRDGQGRAEGQLRWCCSARCRP